MNICWKRFYFPKWHKHNPICLYFMESSSLRWEGKGEWYLLRPYYMSGLMTAPSVQDCGGQRNRERKCLSNSLKVTQNTLNTASNFLSSPLMILFTFIVLSITSMKVIPNLHVSFLNIAQPWTVFATVWLFSRNSCGTTVWINTY